MKLLRRIIPLSLAWLGLAAGASYADPVITDITAYNIKAVEAWIHWTTDVQATEFVDWGTTTAYGNTTTSNAFPPGPVRTHGIRLQGLSPSTVYHYRVRSADANGETVSGDFTFTTYSLPGFGRVTGMIIKDDNGNGTLNPGELIIKDPLWPACPNLEYLQAGIFIVIHSTQFTAYGRTDNECHPVDGTPMFTVDLPPGDYLIQHNTAGPAGWLPTGPNNINLTVTNGGNYHYDFALRPPLSRCDLNQNGSFDQGDMQLVVTAVVNEDTSALYDINRDGNVDVLDVQVVTNVILSQASCPP